MQPTASLLSGNRLHLQHGPIDLIIGADGERERAFDAARSRFETVLTEIVAELSILRSPVHAQMPRVKGETASRMQNAALKFGALNSEDYRFFLRRWRRLLARLRKRCWTAW